VGIPADYSQRTLSAASPVGEALLAIAKLELDFASSHLSALSRDRDEAVHQCRKAIKRLRAIARLGVAVPSAKSKSVDRHLRNAGRLLAPHRDITAVARVLVRLADTEPTLQALESVQHIGSSTGDVAVPVDQVRDELAEVGRRLAALFSRPEAWTFTRIVDGIGITYSAAVSGMKKLERKQSDTRAHEWRKHVQRLAHQLGVIEALCPDFLAPPLQRLAELADVLGEHHDLAVLRARLKTERARLPKKTVAAVAAVAKSLQAQFCEQALALGRELFEQSPRDFRAALLDACGTGLSE
jgi:CHAD domain-containing protein